MGTPSNNRQSLFLSPSDDDIPGPRNPLEPWDGFSRQSPGDVSLTLPMISGSNDTTGSQQPHGHRQPPWQDPLSDHLTPRRSQNQSFPLQSPLGSGENEDFYGSTPDFTTFDWDEIPRLPTSRQTPSRTRESSIVDLTETSPVMMSRTSNKHRQASADSDDERTPKRRKESGSGLDRTNGDNEEGKSDSKVEELDLIDVDDDTTYAEMMKKRQEDLIKQQRQAELDKPLKLATTQCVICLDQPEDLVVTHCGHMFCSLCLHGALNVGTGKRSCPVCRTAIGAPKKDGKQPKNGVFHFEMKLMTRKQGKKPALR